MHYSCYKRPLLLLLILYIVLLALFYTPHPRAGDVSYKIPLKNVTLTGKAVGFPAVKKEKRNVIVKVFSVNGEKTDGYVYARFKEYTPSWHETLELEGKLKKPYSVALPGNFDWAAYLASKDVFTEMEVKRAKVLSPAPWPLRAVAAAREDILRTFEENFDRNLSAVAGGVLLGERGEIDDSLYASFQDSGAIHLLVASGGNVGFVTLVVFACCALFGVSRRKTALLALAVAGVYTLAAGADAPLTRAYFMTVCAVIGYFLRRNSGVFQGLVLSCFVILLFRPAGLFEAGFQMSFLATLAIVVCLNNYELPYQWPRPIKFFVQIFMATLSTQLALLPVFTNVFYKVSFVGLLSNMLLVPMASLLMGLCFAFYVFSLFHAGFLLKAVTWLSLVGFKETVEFFASLPFASVQVSAWRPGTVTAYYAGVFLLFHLPQKMFVRRIFIPVLTVAVLAFSLQFLCFNKPTLWLMNEWNKNAILFRAPDGTRILAGAAIDGDKLARAVLASGAAKLDAVLIGERAEQQLKEVEKLKKFVRVDKVLTAFENTWPGEETAVSRVRVKTLWGVLLNREKKLWTNRGYSGGADSLSYELTYKNLSFTAAANGRFVVKDAKVFDNVRNATKTLHF